MTAWSEPWASSEPSQQPATGVLPGLLTLLGMPLTAHEGEVLQAAVALAMQVTTSPVGFLHHVNDDRRTVEIGACATGSGQPAPVQWDRHVPVPFTGWGRAFWQDAPVVDNDPAWVGQLPGFAHGTGRTRRFLGVPVLEAGGGLLLGLADSPSRYGDQDVRAAADVVGAAWLTLARLREHRAATEDLQLLSEHVAGLRAGTWRWDPDEDSVVWGEGAVGLLAADPEVGQRVGWAVLEGRLEPFSRYGLRQAREGLPVGQPLELELWARDRADRPMKLHLRGRWVTREQGAGMILRGTLADITAQEHAQRAHDRATRDQLTGLTNRAGLIADLNRRIVAGHKRIDDQFAVHLLDLDRFKQVNDTHGHLIGDGVLRAAATRLKATVRRDDLVARLGGDEFVIIQDDCGTPACAQALADRVIAALVQPVDVRGLTLTVGASVGVAFSDPERPNIRDLLARADEALYSAKRRGGGLHIAAPTNPEAEQGPLVCESDDPAVPTRRRRTDSLVAAAPRTRQA